ncbi:PREDICTED: uncharacterized protein LOC104804647 [Tarenaya hassleriana]|uniref:uncharacterized protein LOC104804647 n=1 Tax=Tarenaya hassleriana TaxID=28532 RepID=UPI00053C91C4|nr:PREDICTED: uncharacterized protein LOC104804647 [Tarenaya hassleriana]
MSAPIWVNLTNIPAELYSLKGISYIASGISEPLHTDKMRLDPLSVGEAKVKVEVQLGAILPQAIEIEDEQGSVITVNAAYPWIPPKCINCGEFGHKLQSCPVRQSQPLQRVVETGTSIETVDSQLTIKDVASASTSTLPTSVSLAPNTTNAGDPQIADMNAGIQQPDIQPTCPHSPLQQTIQPTILPVRTETKLVAQSKKTSKNSQRLI